MDDRHQDSSRADAPDVLALQPRPINCQVTYTGHCDGCETDIALVFRFEDARRCRLCAPGRCTATVSDDRRTTLCLRRFDGYIPLERAELFRDPGGLDEGRVVALDARAGAGAPA